MRNKILLLSVTTLFFATACQEQTHVGRESKYAARKSDVGWEEYLGGPDRNHYSPLSQIDSNNVNQLVQAWEYHTGDTGEIQTNPIIIEGILYGMTASVEPFALDAATGKEIWRITNKGKKQFNISRGVAYWRSGANKRILYTQGEWLYAVEAETGKPILSFGEMGRVSLKKGLGKTAKDKMVISTTPGTIYKNLILMPLRVSEGSDAALGHIQAFNVITGELTWVFETIPPPGKFGYETWSSQNYKNTEVGAANNWAGMAVDRKRGIVYVPTGSAGYDFYGANRHGENLFANSLLALNAQTGERIWHYQFVHHDVLDRDVPAPPNLVTLVRNNKKTDAVAQITKQGYIFIFDRETGTPLFPIQETLVPQSDIPGEQTWPTQPIPETPAPFARQYLSEQDISPIADNREELKTILKNSRTEGPFTPLSERGTLVFPGLDGGAEWGGAAVSPEGIMFLNSNEMAWLISLNLSIDEQTLSTLQKGEALYAMNCTPCHGVDLKGNPKSGYPSLVSLKDSQSKSQVLSTIENGKGMMPAFKKFSKQEQQSLINFLFNEETKPSKPKTTPDTGPEQKEQSVYVISGYTKFLDKMGYPAIRPPWGTLNAIDLNTGKYLWKIPYGEYPELIEKGIPVTGSESYGGPILTKSGLLFIAGTKDRKLRAFEQKTGKLLWETLLPAAGFATPSTYSILGKQYLVIACGGTKLGAQGGDSYVAFALPD